MAKEDKPKEESKVKKEEVKKTEKTRPKSKDKKEEKKSNKTNSESKEKKEEVKNTKDKEESKVTSKDKALARGINLRASKKHFMYLSRIIKNKTVEEALSDMAKVVMMKKAVPFKGEIPHRKGKGMMSGRYPVKAASLFIPILKALKGNIIVNGMDPDKARISIASASWASRPMRSGNRSGKRTNLIIIARESEKKNKDFVAHKKPAGGSS